VFFLPPGFVHEANVRESHLKTTEKKIMKSVFDWFRQHFHKWYQPDAKLKECLETMARSDAREVSCDEVFVVLDQFAEAVHRGENVLLFMPLIKRHLDLCPACREEYEALLGVLQPGID
jgi:hypothetical protein